MADFRNVRNASSFFFVKADICSVNIFLCVQRDGWERREMPRNTIFLCHVYWLCNWLLGEFLCIRLELVHFYARRLHNTKERMCILQECMIARAVKGKGLCDLVCCLRQWYVCAWTDSITGVLGMYLKLQCNFSLTLVFFVLHKEISLILILFPESHVP